MRKNLKNELSINNSENIPISHVDINLLVEVRVWQQLASGGGVGVAINGSK